MHPGELCGDLFSQRVIACRIACGVRSGEQLLGLVVAAAGHREAAEHEAPARRRWLRLDLSGKRQHIVDSPAEEHVLHRHERSLVTLRAVGREAARRQERIGRRVPGPAPCDLNSEDDQIRGELGVHPASGGHPMAKRRGLVVHQRRGLFVELRAVCRPERVVRRCLYERVGERNEAVGRRPTLLEEMGGHRPLEWNQRLPELGEPPRDRKPGGQAEHRSSANQASRLRAAPLEAGLHKCFEVSCRWQRQLRRLAQDRGHDLVKDRGRMQRAATGVGSNPIRRAGREVIDSHRYAEVSDRRHIKTAYADPRSVAMLDKAVEPGEMAPR